MASMSKKIESASKALIKAVGEHAKIAGAAHVSFKRAQRAGLKLQAAATKYAEVVFSKTGLESPFTALSSAALESESLDSLRAERASMTTGSTEAIL